MATIAPTTDQPYCLERLEAKIEKFNGGDITAAQGRRLLVDLVTCFVEVGRKVGVVSNNQKKILAALHLDEGPVKDSDWFRTSVKWFVDKVLPKLLEAGIVGAVVWVITINALRYAP